MRDVGTQLADYFDATVERITEADVAASRSIREQPQHPPVRGRQLRPAWALAVTFVTTLAVIGGSLGFGLMLRRQGTDIGGAIDPPATGAVGELPLPGSLPEGRSCCWRWWLRWRWRGGV